MFETSKDISATVHVAESQRSQVQSPPLLALLRSSANSIHYIPEEVYTPTYSMFPYCQEF